MKRIKQRFLALSASVLLLFSLTGCTDYAEWEANRPEADVTYIETNYQGPSISDYEPGEGMVTHIDTDYEGPSLIDYVNEGIEQAKEDGFYTETDYSGISAGEDDFDPDTYKDPRPDPTNQNRADELALERLVMKDYLAGQEWAGEPYIEVHDNETYFSELDYQREPFEYYMELDDLGRSLRGFALLDESLMPEDDEERGDISSVKPTGWVQAKYDGISNGGWLYNRCHLIAWALAGENANEKNLMTGTRYFNVEGMLPFELQVLNYLDDNPGNRVLYRAEPVYDGDDLLAKGLLLEAKSVGDVDDEELEFCVYIFNVQPGIEIDYMTGESRKGE